MRKLSTILLGLVLVSLASLLALSLWLRQPIQTMTHRILFASSKALSQPYNLVTWLASIELNGIT